MITTTYVIDWDLIKNIGIVCAMIVGLTQISLVYNQMKIQTKWRKISATMEYLKTYPELLKFSMKGQGLNLFEKEFPTMNITELKDKLINDQQFKADIMSVAGYFEYLALGIKNGYFDEDTAKEYFHLIALRVHDGLTDYYIVREQQIGRPVCNNFKTLIDSWKNTCYYTTGKKFEISHSL